MGQRQCDMWRPTLLQNQQWHIHIPLCKHDSLTKFRNEVGCSFRCTLPQTASHLEQQHQLQRQLLQS